VSGHLREVKDPFRTAAALRFLPAESRIQVQHIGRALDPGMAREARSWMQREPRYRWLGEVSHGQALRRLARSRVMVISSRMEGGANVIAEAVACGVPPLASHIPGNVGMLGAQYGGYYPPGNERALARLLWQAESDRKRYLELKRQCAARRSYFSRSRERESLKRLLRELA
jgi:glycosyltransferase involved in cell wall biosynthesis